MRHTVGLALASLFLLSPIEAAPRYVAIDLGTLGGSESHAMAVSDDDVVVGDSGTVNGTQHAFLWTSIDGMVDLGTLGGDHSYAVAVSTNGVWVVGRSLAAQNAAWHGFVWSQRTGMLDLDTENSRSQPVAVNNEGIVVGFSEISEDSLGHAFVWTPSTGLLAFGSLSHASA